MQLWCLILIRSRGVDGLENFSDIPPKVITTFLAHFQQGVCSIFRIRVWHFSQISSSTPSLPCCLLKQGGCSPAQHQTISSTFYMFCNFIAFSSIFWHFYHFLAFPASTFDIFHLINTTSVLPEQALFNKVGVLALKWQLICKNLHELHLRINQPKDLWTTICWKHDLPFKMRRDYKFKIFQDFRFKMRQNQSNLTLPN